MTRDEFAAWAASGTILLDGGTGSYLYNRGMMRGVCTELWIMEHPEIIGELQRAYAAAGSQIIYAPTFSANRVMLEGFGLQDRQEEIIKRNVAMTKEHLAGTGVMVAGDMTTTGQMISEDGPMTYERLLDIYKEQITYLCEAGVDLLVAETMLNVDETMALVDAANSVCPDLAIMCTLSLNADGSAIYGGSGVEAVETLQAMGASAVGLNCSVGPDQLEAVIKSMKKVAEVPVIAKPNAGMPFITPRGEAVYSMKAEDFADSVAHLVDCGAGIVGGCCGTTPEYIAALAKKLGR